MTIGVITKLAKYVPDLIGLFGQNGAGLVGAVRKPPNLAKRDKVEFYLATKKVDIWEFEKYITVKPDPNDPNTWDWSPAGTLAFALGKRITLTDGTFRFSEMTVAPGTQIEGEGGDRFNPKTILTSISPGTKLLTTPVVNTGVQRSAFAIEGCRLISDSGVTFGDPTKAIIDAGGTSAYEMHPHMAHCSLAPLTASSGYGCFLAKAFNFALRNNDFTGFARSIVELGSDLGYIGDNRIINFSEYGILQLSTGTFGSQSELRHNDILGGGVGSIYIKSTSRHARIIDNYCERSTGNTVSGFIDVSTIGAPVYGPNPVPASVFLSVDVDENRLDGQNLCADFIYRYEPVGYNVKIKDVGTTGTHNTLPWLTVVGDGVPLYSTVNTGNAVQLRHEFVSSGERRWAEFKPESLRMLEGGVAFNYLSLSALNPLELRRNNSFLHVRQNDHAFVLKSTLGATLFHCILPILTVNGADINNPWLRAGASYTVTVVARMVSGTGTLRCLKIVDAASQGVAVDTPLTTQWQKITMTMTGTADTTKVGVAFAHNVANTTDIEILSVSFKEA